MVAEHSLADAAEVALHGVLHVPQAVPPESPMAARLPALPPVHPRRSLWHVIICKQVHRHEMISKIVADLPCLCDQLQMC